LQACCPVVRFVAGRIAGDHRVLDGDAELGALPRDALTGSELSSAMTAALADLPSLSRCCSAWGPGASVLGGSPL
jgi:hypothetical protein